MIDPALYDDLKFLHELAEAFIADRIADIEDKIEEKDTSGLGWETAAELLPTCREDEARLEAIYAKYLAIPKEN